MASKDIVVTQTQIEGTDRALGIEKKSMLVPYKLSDTMRVKKVNCKLCNADCRDEAESYFERTPNYIALKNWLKDTYQIEISYPAVRNHILFHFKAKQREEYLGEFSEDVAKWKNMQENRVDAIKNRMALLNREMVIIAAETEDQNIIERRKSAETMKKIADTLLIYENKLDDYEKTLEPVTIILSQLKIIITDELKDINSNQVKKTLANVLGRLQDKVGDIMITKRE